MVDHRSRLAAILRRARARRSSPIGPTSLAKATRGGVDRAEVEEQARAFVALLADAMARDACGRDRGPAWAKVREMLGELSPAPGRHQGSPPPETATFIFSLKQPLFARLREYAATRRRSRASCGPPPCCSTSSALLPPRSSRRPARRSSRASSGDARAVHAGRQALGRHPGAAADRTLDSARTQVVMETLLQRIVETGAEIAIIDITGVPTVDTLVAQHLLKTVTAARLMGADCIISGIRPQIAQTIVHLGVDLGDVTTKATLADAFVARARAAGRRGRPASPAPSVTASRHGAHPDPQAWATSCWSPSRSTCTTGWR